VDNIVTNSIDLSLSLAEIPQSALEESRIYASRHEMIKDLPKHATIIEVGVAYGDFSEHLIKTCQPHTFIGVDHFGFEKFPEVWGQSPKLRLGGQSHEEFYLDRIRKIQETVDFEYIHMPGNSSEMILKSPLFDIAYIDAGHSYEEVAIDLKATLLKLKPGGHIVFNDYIWRDTHNANIYGVVEVANNLIAKGGFKVKGLALNPKLFNDLWIQQV